MAGNAPQSRDLENILRQADHRTPDHNGKDGHEKKEEAKSQTPLEEITQGLSDVIKVGIGGAIPYFFGKAFPNFATDAAILSGAQVASDYTTSYKRGKKYTPTNFIESTALGTAITLPLETMFGAVNSMPLNSFTDYLMKGTVWGGIAYPFFVGIYQPLAYFIRNRTFSGMWKYVKENYWSTMKTSWKKLLPFSLLNVFFAPTWLQIPISAVISYAFDLIGAPQKEEVPEHLKRQKVSYLSGASGLVGKTAKSVFYGIPQFAYSVADRLADLTYRSKGSSAPTPAPAATGGH